MKHIIAYSGGHSSALVAIEVCRKFGKENVILLNHDINQQAVGHFDLFGLPTMEQSVECTGDCKL